MTDRFADPRATVSERFVWDYWHVPEQVGIYQSNIGYFPVFWDHLSRTLRSADVAC